MEKCESIVITGAKYIAKHTDYSNKTKFAGTVEDNRPLDGYGRIGKF